MCWKRAVTLSILVGLALTMNAWAQALTPIKGASVVASGMEGYGIAITGADGLFRISEGLGEGVYTVAVRAKGYVSREIMNVEVKAGELDLGVISLEPSGIISGVVETPEGKPAPSVPVTLKGQDGRAIEHTTSSSDGSFIFDTNIVNGTYTVEAYAYSFEGLEYTTVSMGFTQVHIFLPKGGAPYLEGYTSGVVQGVKAIQGEKVEGIRVRLGLSGIISGRVMDLQGNPISKILVLAYPAEGEGPYGFISITGDDGRYRIANNLATGNYNVTLLFPKGYVWSFLDAERVHVEAGKETPNVDFNLERSGTLSGVVLYSDNRPAANASVVAGSMDGRYFGFTASDVDGTFKIESGLGTAAYQVMAFLEASFSMPVTVQVRAGDETKDVKLIITGTGKGMAAIEGRVLDERGNPLGEVRVSSLGVSEQTDEDGKYRLIVPLPEGVAATNVTVEASKTGYKRAFREDVKISVGETVKDVDFSLETLKVGTIRGRVVAAAPAPPPKKTAHLSIVLSSGAVKVGEPVTITGTITPSLSGDASILVASDTEFKEIAKVSIRNGGFTYSFYPPSVGSYKIKASWPGDPEYNPAESATLTLKVERISPTISISSSKTKANLGETVRISGSISPFKKATEVIIVVSSPADVKEYKVSSEDGEFKYDLKLEAKGTYRVKARVPEGSTYSMAESGEVQITVEEVKAEERRCIIATATFGSELTPEVNFLRSFRDGLILSTMAGRAFYMAFDAFYYSWSTPVADHIEASPALRYIAKALIYPLLGALKLTAVSSSPIFEFSPEAAAILSGFIASSLIGAIYISPILIAASLIANRGFSPRSPSMRILKLLWLSVAASLTFIVIGLALRSSPLLIASTSTYVLLIIASTSTSILRLFNTLKKRQ